MKCFSTKTLLPLLVVSLLSTLSVYAQDAASDADKAFVAKVSQGGRYEVEASQLALTRASAQDVKDLAAAEMHDHELVNRKLKSTPRRRTFCSLRR